MNRGAQTAVEVCSRRVVCVVVAIKNAKRCDGPIDIDLSTFT